ncbi:MAG: DNA gyrase inhibitor YacG [Butyrivibrio sp.]|nr:DNA gyrase inhibitor YacG [Butyrivibrio sp.]
MTNEQKDKIRQLRNEGMGYKEISDVIGLSSEAIRSFCRRDNKSIRPKVNVCETFTDKCPVCGKTIEQTPHKKHKKFCSDKCRMSWWNSHMELVKRKAIYDKVCAYCNKPFSVYGRKNQKYCCMECYRNGRRSHNG